MVVVTEFGFRPSDCSGTGHGLILDLLVSDRNFLSRALGAKSCWTNVSGAITKEALLVDLKKLDSRADETLRNLVRLVAKIGSRADEDTPEDMYTVF